VEAEITVGGNTSIMNGSCKDCSQSELRKGDQQTNHAPDTSCLSPFSSSVAMIGPKLCHLSYVITFPPPTHFSSHVNQIQPPWKRRQHVPPKRWN